MKYFRVFGLIGWLWCCHFVVIGQDVEALMREANGFFNQKKYTNALNYYEKVLAVEANNRKAVFRAGVCYLEIGQYDNALDYFEIIKQYQDTTLKDFRFWYAKANYYNQQFDTAYHYLKTTSLTYGKEAMELRRNIDNAMSLKKTKKDYIVQNAGSEINTPFDEVAPLLNKDLKKMIFTRQIIPQKLDNTNVIEKKELYYTQLQLDNTWQKTILLPYPTEQSTVVAWTEDDTKLHLSQQGTLVIAELLGTEIAPASPLKGYVNPKDAQQTACTFYDYGQKIIFASNFNTKNGDYDLFESTLRRDATWSSPTPLSTLNSPEDENTPFVAADGKTLYFSSKGHQNIGGYDIFKSVYDENTKTWSKPENMGLPINSVADDWWFSCYDDISYMSSNRTGGIGKSDIYKIYFFPKIKISGKVFHRHSKEIVPNSTIRFSHENQVFEVKTDENARYETLLPFDKTWVVKVFLEEKALYEEHLQLQIGNKKPNLLNRNFYIDNQNDIAAIAKPNDNAMQIIGKVTDAKTSQGLTLPIQLFDEMGNIVQSTSSDALGNYQFTIEKPKGKFWIEAHKKGYLLVSNSADFSTVQDKKITVHLQLSPIEPNAKLILRNVYFAKGSATLDKTSYPALNQLVLFLKENAEVKIEVGGHTDNTGTPPENQLLSEERAKTIALYLQNKGIAAKRLSYKGYGDTQPLASNDDEVDGREINRRIEIKVVK